MKTMKNERYLFSWNDIPGIDSSRLIEFLKHDLGIDWVEKEHIQEKEISEKLTISDGNKSISLILNDISEMSIFFPQVVIGATAAFILFLVLKAGGFQIYEKPISGIETIGVFSFLAGFSEPYFLSILGKVGHQDDSSRKN